MSKWKRIGLPSLGAIAISMSACSTSYDCSNPAVADALVEQATGSGFAAHMKDVPEDWKARFADHTTARNVVTLDENEEIQHFRCKANLEYREGARTVTSKDITYEVRKIEGEDDFTLEWEVESNSIANVDPINMFAFDVQLPWKGELEKQQEKEYHRQVASQKEEARAWARGFAADYAAKHPPLPFDRDALRDFAATSLSNQHVEFVLDQFHDIDGDGFPDYFAIFATSNFDPGEFAEDTENYGESTNTGGFMSKNYFYVAITQKFDGYGRKTNMGINQGKITTAIGEKVTEKYLRKDIESVASAPKNPIVGISNSDGYIVVALESGQPVTIKDFKSEKTLEQLRQEWMQDLEDRLTTLRENGDNISSLYQ